MVPEFFINSYSRYYLKYTKNDRKRKKDKRFLTPQLSKIFYNSRYMYFAILRVLKLPAVGLICDTFIRSLAKKAGFRVSNIWERSKVAEAYANDARGSI